MLALENSLVKCGQFCIYGFENFKFSSLDLETSHEASEILHPRISLPFWVVFLFSFFCV